MELARRATDAFSQPQPCLDRDRSIFGSTLPHLMFFTLKLAHLTLQRDYSATHDTGMTLATLAAISVRSVSAFGRFRARSPHRGGSRYALSVTRTREKKLTGLNIWRAPPIARLCAANFCSSS
jgi:hypothetical protein